MPLIVSVLPGTPRAYDVRIASGLRHEINVASPHLTVTDRNVYDCWSKDLEPDALVIPAGEEHKRIETVVEIAEACVRRHLGRDGMLVAVGGGVTGDMTGFASAIYMRGIDFVQVPTTLLSMTDSSVGGKTGCDLAAGKNLLGAFHQPRAVLIDPDFLTTLPEKELRNGFAEIIKMAFVFDGEFFAELERLAPEALLDPAHPAYPRWIERSCRIKAEVVAQDEKETSGRRALLNFGHTYGHAIEKLSDYRVSHGYAVAIGMRMASREAQRRGMITTERRQRLETLLERMSFPLDAPDGISDAQIADAMRSDKKCLSGKVRLILPTDREACLVDL